jgi:exodeoxyribonuclease VIII
MITRELPFNKYRKAVGINASLLKQLLTNPYAALHRLEDKDTPALALGKAVHNRILTPDCLRTDLKLTAAQIETIEGINTAVTKSPVRYLLADGDPEISIFATIEANGKSYEAKARLDYLTHSGIIIDIKTASDASPDGFTKACANYDYALQAAFYIDVCRAEGLHISQFVFLAIETKPPYMVGIYELDSTWIDFGRSEYRRALEIYDRSEDYADYPIYRDITNGAIKQTLAAPSWIFYRRGASY